MMVGVMVGAISIAGYALQVFLDRFMDWGVIGGLEIERDGDSGLHVV